MSETILIRPWCDELVDTLGHDPRSRYPEIFWLPTLGPTTLLLLRHLATLFDRHPDGFDLPVAETSRCLGLGDRAGRNSPLARSVARLVQFELAVAEGPARVAVRRNLPPVNRRHVRRLPPTLQAEHENWVKARLAEPPLALARRNARRMAVVLLGAGENTEGVEHALATAGFHPALCRESATWAWERLDAEPRQLLPVA